MRTVEWLFLTLLLSTPLLAQQEQAPQITQWSGKTIMLFGAHPDDETPPAGTLALLRKNGNRVLIVIYTNGNKGSLDPEMTSERLSKIRYAESLAGLKHLGIPKEDYINLGYDDGELEYVDRRELVGRICRLLRQHRPDALFTHEIGKGYMRWQKSDHRSAGYITADAARAALFPLYNHDQILYEGLRPFEVPHYFFFGSLDPNYFVDISSTLELKARMRTEHISQSEPNWSRYTGTISSEDRQKIIEQTKASAVVRNGKPHEAFRHYSGCPDDAGN